MSDPTEIALSGGFAAALGLFVIAALLRRFAGGRRGGELAGAGELPPPVPVGRVAVWPYRAWDLLGAGFVFAVFCGLILGSVQAAKEVEPVLDPGMLVVNIGFQFFMAGVVCVVMLPRQSVVSWLGLRWAGWPWVFLIAPLSVVGMWVVFGGLHVSGYVKWMESLGVETVQNTVKLLQESEDPVILGLMAFAAVVAAPICEEVVFRGYFYPVMKRFAGAWPAALCSALVFAAAHGSLTALLPLFLFGLVLVLVYEKTGSLWAPMAVHFCFNLATVLVQVAVRVFDLPVEGMS